MDFLIKKINNNNTYFSGNQNVTFSENQLIPEISPRRNILASII